jgi:5-methylcytosine-specific restriction endonuclease McrBC GTP-binding regulatory subunit McrB
VPLSNDEIFDQAIVALKSMLAIKGPDYKFPADAIWEYFPSSIDVDVEVPSLSRPHQSGRLVRAGYLVATSDQLPAQAKKASKSLRRAYRFGPELVTPTHTPMVGAPTSVSDMLVAVKQAMEYQGYMINEGELANFYLAMTVSPLVILSGISGTGKSLLPRKFADLTNSGFRAIAVQPQWSDNSDLFGFVPTLTPDRHTGGALINILREAKKAPTRLAIALLDEMNLAQVEHYFSDFLSVAETRHRKGGRILTDSLPIELPTPPSTGTDSYADIRDTSLPSNLRIVGTANMDESTHIFSPKVLDRAFTIELDDPVLTDFATPLPAGETPPDIDTFSSLAQLLIDEKNAISIMEARRASQPMFEYIAALLGEIQEILEPAGIKFGYRTRDAILLYMHFWSELKLDDVLSGHSALDFCILQKILPKISGSGDALGEALIKLAEWLDARDDPTTGAAFPMLLGKLNRSAQKARRMAKILEVDGATRFWGA